MSLKDKALFVAQTHYVTYFDSFYLSRGLALISSLREQGEQGQVHVLALDVDVYDFLMASELQRVIVHRVDELEQFEPRLLDIKTSRSRAEYIFTCTPWVIKLVRDRFAAAGELVVYLDSDLYFVGEPVTVINAMGDNSVGIIEHRYNRRLSKKLSKYGRFNVGWVGFRHEALGDQVLDWYAESTLEWCSDFPLDGKYADQGYLDSFPDFEGVVILDSLGFNLAPWNQGNASITLSGDSLSGKRRIRVGADDLIFFHAHGLKKLKNRYVSAELLYGSRANGLLKQYVYTPYVNSLESMQELTGQRVPRGFRAQSRGGKGLRGLVTRSRKKLVELLSIIIGNYVIPGRKTPRSWI